MQTREQAYPKGVQLTIASSVFIKMCARTKMPPGNIEISAYKRY